MGGGRQRAQDCNSAGKGIRKVFRFQSLINRKKERTSQHQVLIEKEQSIRDNTYGSIVWRNCNLKTFKMGVKTWEDAERKKKRKLETFEKILNSTENCSEVANGVPSEKSEVTVDTIAKECESPVEKKKKKKKRKVEEESVVEVSSLPAPKIKKSKKVKISSNG